MPTDVSHGVNGVKRLMANIKDSKQVMILRLSRCCRGSVGREAACAAVHVDCQAQSIIEAWRVEYHYRRPHSSFRHLTPNEDVIQRQANEIAEEVAYSG